jgi:dethiobiotin synthetase
MARGYFITGTDTGIGKTLVSCALLHAFAENGKKVIGMKPIAAGSENGRWLDVDLLMAASTVSAPNKIVNPFALVPSLAPHIAAKQANIEIDLAAIKSAYDELQEMADVIIVEGVGGFMVPLNDQHDGTDLARMLGLPVIMVVGLRLGCLNHALMTAQTIRANKLLLSGWIANGTDPEMLAKKDNIQALEQRLACPLIGVLPHLKGIDLKLLSQLLAIKKLQNIQV